jgi:flagellar basal body-associated protein FliL
MKSYITINHMKKRNKALDILLGTIIVVMVLGMLFTFLFMVVNEDKLAFNTMTISVCTIAILLVPALILDVKNERA